MLACLIQTHTHTNRETEMQLCEQQKRPPVWSHGSALCVCVCIRDIHTLSPLTLTKLSFCRMRLYGASSPTDFWFLLWFALHRCKSLRWMRGIHSAWCIRQLKNALFKQETSLFCRLQAIVFRKKKCRIKCQLSSFHLKRLLLNFQKTVFPPQAQSISQGSSVVSQS